VFVSVLETSTMRRPRPELGLFDFGQTASFEHRVLRIAFVSKGDKKSKRMTKKSFKICTKSLGTMVCQNAVRVPLLLRQPHLLVRSLSKNRNIKRIKI
jgi:hypothetical protein